MLSYRLPAIKFFCASNDSKNTEYYCPLIAEKHHGTIEIIRNRSVSGFLLLLFRRNKYMIIVVRFILGILGVQDPSIEYWVLQPFWVSEKMLRTVLFLVILIQKKNCLQWIGTHQMETVSIMQYPYCSKEMSHWQHHYDFSLVLSSLRILNIMPYSQGWKRFYQVMENSFRIKTMHLVHCFQMKAPNASKMTELNALIKKQLWTWETEIGHLWHDGIGICYQRRCNLNIPKMFRNKN